MKQGILACVLVLAGASLPLSAGVAGEQAAPAGHGHGHAMPGHGPAGQGMQGHMHGQMQGQMQGQAMPGHGAHAMAGHHGPAAGDVAQRLAKAETSTTLEASECWIRSLPAPAPSGGYFALRNKGDKPVKLLAASAPVYGMVMLHRTTTEGGMSRMSEAGDITIDAGATLEFKPGGYHLMLGPAQTAPATGSKVKVEFLFDNGQKTVADCEVKPANTPVR